MLTLKDISIQKTPAKCMLPSSGVEVTMKAVPYCDVLAIRAAFVQPQVPFKDDPNKGSLADKIPDYHDAAYQAELREWTRSCRIVTIARSMGFVPAIEQAEPPVTSVPPAAKVEFGSALMTTWAMAVEEELTSVLTEKDLATLGDCLDRLHGEGDAASGAVDPKAFSSLSAPVQAAVKALVDLLSQTSSPNTTA